MSSQKRNVQARRRTSRSGVPGKRVSYTGGASAALLASASGSPAASSSPETTTWQSVVSDTTPETVTAPEAQPQHEAPVFPDWRAEVTQRGRELWDRALSWLAARSVEWWLWFGVIALATILRFWNLGAKPLHHDESMHAYFSLLFAQDPSSYSYDPLLHGPFQFHAEGTMFALLLALQHIFDAGAVGNPWINDTSARFVPALFGIGIVALPYGIRRELGRAGALIAAFLLAISPSFVYFSRFLREDIYFNFFMFAMVVAAIRFAHERTLKRLVYLVIATVLAYATFEGFFLTIAIFVGFLAMIVSWELAGGLAGIMPAALTDRERVFFSRALVFALLGGLASALGVVALHELNSLSTYINNNPVSSATQVQNLENNTVAILLYASILIALLVIGTLIWQMYQDDARAASDYQNDDFDWGDEDESQTQPYSEPPIARLGVALSVPGRKLNALRARIDPDRQPFLALMLNISWVQWFIAFVVAWAVFAALFYIVPGGAGAACSSIGKCFQTGVGKGIWQGLYYWLEQQKVARGGQPFYYYLLLMPLYEQLAIVFGLAGIVYSLKRPNRFRLFLVFWFAGSLGLYSWAGEKMPWLVIHILLPLMLLAAVSLNWVAQQCYALFQRIRLARQPAWTEREGQPAVSPESARRGLPAWLREVTAGWRPRVALVSALGAVLLLIPMIHSMLTLTYTDPAKGPLEMMVYVQTTNDVDLVMGKIKQADQALYGGKHELRIGVGAGEEWPFYWYLRDYPNTMFGYTSNDPRPVDVIIMYPAYDANHNDAQTFMANAAHKAKYTMKQYKLRSWWDESYKPRPCVATKTHPCPASAAWGSGVGLGQYLSYGSFPPPNAQFDLGRTVNRLWSWLWLRQPLGDTGGSYDFTFIVRNGVPIQP